MSVTHTTAVRNAAADAVVDLIDAGGGANGTLEILDGVTVLSTHDMADPAFGPAASGTATADTIQNATAGNTGTADGWKAKDKDGTEIMSGTAGQKLSIAAVSTGYGGQFQVAGNYSAVFTVRSKFTVVGSSNNDGYWTVRAVTWNDPNTEIDVAMDEEVGATADGQLHLGECGLDNVSIVSGQTVTVSSMTYTALSS